MVLAETGTGTGNPQTKEELVRLLKEAAKLENCLLNTYLYAASSLKSMPQEFAKVSTGDGVEQDNRRRAIQMERVRSWKQALLEVSHEEMIHLHYVECMLRALGEPPCFELPERNNGNWFIPEWDPDVPDRNPGVEVPVERLTWETIKNLVLFESSTSLQPDLDLDKFGELLNQLYDFELDLRLEEMLLNVTPQERDTLKPLLEDIYKTLTPLPGPPLEVSLRAAAITTMEVQNFHSIGDLYLEQIQPLYQKAFDEKWVTHNNLTLGNEQLNPEYAGEGFLPTGPVYRSKNFEKEAQKNRRDLTRDFKSLEKVIQEIVDEGEGFPEFIERAEELLEKLPEIGGAKGYLERLRTDRGFLEKSDQQWFEDAQKLRVSHLYRFAMIMTEFEKEQTLAERSGVDFIPSRQPIDVENNPNLTDFLSQLPLEFNACYLVLLAWLSRMYEIREWMADRPRRMAIEMLASWPLMSLAIRPFLELASFFPVDLTSLFRLEREWLPQNKEVEELYNLYVAPERSEEINERMDELAVVVLSQAATWAKEQEALLQDSLPDSNTKEIILARLKVLTRLDEFEKQFSFRIHGGYSDRMPDLDYQSDPKQGDSELFEEDPSNRPSEEEHRHNPLYQNTLALRLRFSGWGLVQLSTDPDPPCDEVGCTGTHMLHAADGDRRFDQSLFWQNTDSARTILRTPREELPQVGVKCTEVSLVVTNGAAQNPADRIAQAGYAPLQIMNSTGAVQTSGVQQALVVEGFTDVLTLESEDISLDHPIRFDLLEKQGVRPFLNGVNHLVWQDGEPIDPFILQVSDSNENSPNPLFQREIHNQNLIEKIARNFTIMEMKPLQRLESARGPCGFDSYKSIPDWVKNNLSETERSLLDSADYPMSYLKKRAEVLVEALINEIEELKSGGEVNLDDVNQSQVDTIVSWAERMLLVSYPRKNTTIEWLKFLLNYGHTVSGDFGDETGNNPIFSAFETHTKLNLSLTKPDQSQVDWRNQPNARWLMKYTLGVMDTDALTDLVFGELYIPVTVEQPHEDVQFTRSWIFPATVKDAISDYAIQFDNAFWADYSYDGGTRTLQLPDGTRITETLQGEPTADYYRYNIVCATNEDIQKYTGNGEFKILPLVEKDNRIKLEWKVSFNSSQPQTIVSALSLFSAAADQMTDKMDSYLGPSDPT